ncbi:MAG TPA: hypothetical protein VMB34_14370 [Acetobacteraceae bacterium]|nr:hypothetical protein [Acetobacteraceae bacterium]
MDTSLAEQGLGLRYLRDPSRSEVFDPCRILEDLYEGGAALAMLPSQSGLRMAGSDHVVFAAASGSGRCLGVIAASDRGTAHEPFLLLDAVYLAPSARPSLLLLQRMLSFLMLRIAGSESVPNIIAACVQTPCFVSMLRAFGQRFRGAALFPAQPGDIVIDLGMASLARRIVRVVRPGSRCEAANGTFQAASLTFASSGYASTETLVLLDLGGTSDATILEDARRLYRTRLPRGARRGDAPALADATVPASSPLQDATAV